MKKALIILALLATMNAYAQHGLKYIIVKHYDYSKELSYKLLTTEELKALQAEIKLETSLFAKALRNTQKEWKNKGNKSRFPSCASKRKVQPVGRPITDMAKAMEAIAKYEEKLVTEAKVEEEKLKTKKNAAMKDKQGAQRIRAEARFEEKLKKEQAKKDELSAARDLFVEELKKLMPVKEGEEEEEEAKKEEEEAPADKKKKGGH